MTTIQIRIDEETKKSAQKVLNELGLDMSTAIKAFFRQVVLKKGIPFRIVTENGLTLEEEDSIIEAALEAKRGKNIKGPFNSAEQLISELKK
ncbi:type II toxin-antitoxin system RelB/DinJ family antitoxin [Candidatus Peregrinibacteria bacterium]|jgi:DNA-damage-inducible protein J|nr:type II toxin-antitoxin system RelB/DinJ family antitoxin [Candidatus Peregrinibacteria bacterium]MBT4148212.1 type II toxin-antitoxin system RelB/DinJ family antitoxin [Candidatus Peregrinibacteria bacterium]MBT4455976.1 type II toxin-antitoxin system RelB/DinJ family antitoxin [Candidatus Peregrinibacteria bacterium]